MATFEVTLGEAKHKITVPNMKKSREWRKKFEEPLSLIMGSISEIGGELSHADLGNGDDLTRLFSTVTGALFGTLGKTLIGSVDLLADMLFSYSPELAAQREVIEEVATDEEMLAALLEVIKAAYPFGSLLKAIPTGPRKPPTSTN